MLNVDDHRASTSRRRVVTLICSSNSSADSRVGPKAYKYRFMAQARGLSILVVFGGKHIAIFYAEDDGHL
jgi:hypothetical protein